VSLYPVLPGAGDAFTEDGRMVAVRLQDVVSPLHGGGPLAAGGEVAHIRLGLSVRLRPDSPARVPAVPGLPAASRTAASTAPPQALTAAVTCGDTSPGSETSALSTSPTPIRFMIISDVTAPNRHVNGTSAAPAAHLICPALLAEASTSAPGQIGGYVCASSAGGGSGASTGIEDRGRRNGSALPAAVPAGCGLSAGSPLDLS
jgi:hypothetical protein